MLSTWLTHVSVLVQLFYGCNFKSKACGEIVTWLRKIHLPLSLVPYFMFSFLIKTGLQMVFWECNPWARLSIRIQNNIKLGIVQTKRYACNLCFCIFFTIIIWDASLIDYSSHRRWLLVSLSWDPAGIVCLIDHCQPRVYQRIHQKWCLALILCRSMWKFFRFSFAKVS